MLQGKTIDTYESTPASKPVPGGPGSQWRMMKLRRVYETAEEEKKRLEKEERERLLQSTSGANEKKDGGNDDNSNPPPYQDI